MTLFEKWEKNIIKRKFGHIGTLDPLASGVLPVLMGNATKLSDYLMEHDKEYVAKIKLGEKTDTGDREGAIIEKHDVPETINQKDIENCLKTFLGESFQIPPMYSAIKVNGKKLYELARSGQKIEREPRKITITDIELLNFDKANNTIEYRVVCSKGTYIRVLCEDISKKLNTCGYMTSLRRTRVGDYTLEDSGKFIPLEKIIPNSLKITLKSQTQLVKFLNGVKLKTFELDILETKKPLNAENSEKFPSQIKLENNKSDRFLDETKDDGNLSIKKFRNQLCNIYFNNKFIGIGKIENCLVKRFIINS